MKTLKFPKNSKGLGLIEILIAISVISFGFLALYRLQVSTMNSAVSANQQYVATYMAQDMAERIRSNLDEDAPMDYTMSDYGSISCSGLCEEDLKDWLDSLADPKSLPEGEGMVEKIDNQTMQIKIRWLEKGKTDKSVYTLEFSLNEA